jgi:hypothetical protein
MSVGAIKDVLGDNNTVDRSNRTRVENYERRSN